MSDSRPISSSLLAETEAHRIARRFNLRQSILQLIGSSSPHDSLQTYRSVAVSMHITKPKTIWQHGLIKAKKLWRKAVRQQHRKSAEFRAVRQSHGSFFATNVPANEVVEEPPHPVWPQLGEVEARQVPTVYQHGEQRNSSTPSIVRSSPSNKHHLLHVGTSEVSENTNRYSVHIGPSNSTRSSTGGKRKSVRYSHPVLTRVERRSPRASDANTSQETLVSPRAGFMSSRTSGSSATTANTSIYSGKVNPFAKASLRLKEREKTLSRLQSLNRIDGVRTESQRGISRTISKHRARREASILGEPFGLPYFAFGDSRRCLKSLTQALESITGNEVLEQLEQRGDTLAALEGKTTPASEAERTMTDHEFIQAWERDAGLRNSGRRSTQWPGQPRPYSHYMPLPAVIESADEPAPQRTSQVPRRPVPATTRIITPQVPFSPDEIAQAGQDKGKKAADPQVQRNLEEARQRNVAVRTEMEIPASLRPPTQIGNVSEAQVPAVLKPATKPPIRESRYNYPLPPLPREAEMLAVPKASLKRKPLPSRPVEPTHTQPASLHQTSAPQRTGSKKRDIVAKVMLKTYYYEP